MKRRKLIAGALGGALVPLTGRAWAQPVPKPRPVIKLGVLTDLSGSYAGIAGEGSAACVRLAARDFAANASPPFDIEVISADHRNDPARGAAMARHWFADGGVNAILDVPNSDVALAVAAVARAANGVLIDCGAGTTALTAALPSGACPTNIIHWSFSTGMLARSTGGALTHSGGSTWFFIAPDDAFGRQLQADTTQTVITAGGRIEGASDYVFPGTTDFTPMLRDAEQSGAAVLGLANAGSDITACVRGAAALGLKGQMQIACLLMQLPDVHALGLELAGGLLLTESFYWDSNTGTRAFTARLMEQEKPRSYPDMIQAGCYAGALHYLRALTGLAATSWHDGALAVTRMKAMPTDDEAFGQARIRSDGRVMLPAFLFQVKTPAESGGPWDCYRLVSTTSAEDAYAGTGGCVLALR